jgi:protein-S-isoprenylcysteine O-methyltransferase Ste14
MYLGPLVLGLLLKGSFPVPFLPRGMRHVLGWPLLGGGVLLMNWFFWTLRSAGTPCNPEKPVSSLVTDGPFRYTRNPGYLSMAVIYTGIASLANAFWVILFLPTTMVVIRRGVIEREEPYLERKFGEEYLR